MTLVKRSPFEFGNLWRNFWNRVSGRYALGEKSEYGVWAETLNPLRGVTEQGLQDIFDAARAGVYAQLAYIYREIESADPTLLTCAERREAAIGASDWKITTSNPERATGWDEALAQEQKDYLYKAYGRAADSIGMLAEHLDGAFFRGFAHARPVFEGDAVAGFETFDAWNFALDKFTGRWWWNPDASNLYTENFTPVPDGELITLVRQRHIDYPALAIFIRAALGERKYGVFLERFGIPPVTVVMPEYTSDDDRTAYMESAQKLAQGGSGALPYGSQVSYSNGARGANPFAEFLRRQQELIVIMATGGTLTTLASPTGIGGGASDVQDATWRGIVGRDIRAAARAVNRTVTRRLLDMRFPGLPALAMFEFDPDPAPTAAQAFEDGAKARAAGYRIVQKDLEDASGYTLEVDTPPPQVTGSREQVVGSREQVVGNKPEVIGDAPMVNSSDRIQPATSNLSPPTSRRAEAAGQDPVAKRRDPVAKREDGAEAGMDTPRITDAAEAATGAFLGDMQKWQEMAKELAADPSPEKARALIAKMREEGRGSALAKAMEEWIATTYAGQLSEAGGIN